MYRNNYESQPEANNRLTDAHLRRVFKRIGQHQRSIDALQDARFIQLHITQKKYKQIQEEMNSATQSVANAGYMQDYSLKKPFAEYMQFLEEMIFEEIDTVLEALGANPLEVKAHEWLT